MSKPNMFSSLARWLNGTSASIDGETPTEPTTIQTGDDGGEGEGEGAEDGGEGDAEDAAGEEDQASAAAQAAADAAQASAEAQANANDPDAFKAGVASANRRWAQILTNKSCMTNLELAASLAVETDFSAAKIGEFCATAGAGKTAEAPAGDSAALQLLARTGKPNVRNQPKGGAANDGEEGKSARKNATNQINAARGGGK